MAEEWKKVFITPQKFHDDILKLAELIRPNKDKYKYLYGIPRGGCIVAIWLSHQLGIEYVTDVDLEVLGPNSKILIVDDIADTGITLEKFDDLGDTATLHYKPRSSVKPTYYVEETSDWIVYPYEKAEEEPNREV